MTKGKQPDTELYSREASTGITALPADSGDGLKIRIDNPPIGQTLGECVEDTLRRYFELLDGFECAGVYEMVLNEVEGPLLKVVLEYCDNNQSRAAEVLGLNRGTLRKKMKLHNML